MRYDAEHKQRTHEKVVKAAAKAIRAKGPERIGVADIMADVGLTHGGFYAHFKSKGDLVAAAVGQMFEESRARLLRETEGRTPARALSDYLDFYLSREHRDARRSGCPVAALASDLPRLSHKVREQFSEGNRRLTAALATLLVQIGHKSAESDARSMFAEMLGALSMARIESDTSRSDAILENSRTALKRRFGLEKQS
jgi:TetR/AcrR family transcriptional regulator, transcriptional repressor for nem operon